MTSLKNDIIALYVQGNTYGQIAGLLNCSKSTVSYNLRKHFSGELRLPSARNRYDWGAVQEYYDEHKSVKKTLAHFGMCNDALIKARKEGRFSYTADANKIPLNAVTVENSTYPRGHLKRRLIDDEILVNECSICQAPPIWQGKPLVLILDHINGVNNDNRLENLRLLCPNCNSQTDTFAGRNIKRSGD